MLEILELIDKKCDTDPDLVDLEEAEGYARDFALEVLERLGFDKETRERVVKELVDEMWLRQHPKHGNTASKPPAPHSGRWNVKVDTVRAGELATDAVARLPPKKRRAKRPRHSSETITEAKSDH